MNLNRRFLTVCWWVSLAILSLTVEDGMAPSLWLAIFIPIIGARSLSSKFWEQLGHPKTSVRANFKENSTFPNIWRKLHIDEMFLLYMFSIVIQDMMARLWLLLQELLPPLGIFWRFFIRMLHGQVLYLAYLSSGVAIQSNSWIYIMFTSNFLMHCLVCQWRRVLRIEAIFSFEIECPMDPCRSCHRCTCTYLGFCTQTG